MFKLNYPNFWDNFGFIPILLYPFSIIYRVLGCLRRLFAKKFKFNFPVICIGNVSIGGTGKTVLVKNLALHYLNKKKRVVVICKGYGGNFVKSAIIDPNFPTSLAGDEAIEIAKELYHKGDIEIIIAKCPSDAEKEIEQLKPDIIIVDDGLQNPNFEKDIKILMVDGQRGFGNEMIIPSGPLRNDLKIALAEVDFIVSIDPNNLVKERLRKLSKNVPEFIESNLEFEYSKDSRIFAFCGIGNPEKFYNKLESSFKVNGTMTFPDHYKYTEKDINLIITEAHNQAANIIVTTRKDMVKIQELHRGKNIVAAEISLNEKDMNNLIKRIDAKIKI